MSFNPNKPVSLEEYDTTLRSSVNAYYEHVMNDPTMSKEETIKSTAEMSEKYLDAVQEFQETQGMQSTARVGTNEGIQFLESNGIHTDTNAVDAAGVSTTDTGVIDSGVTGVGDDGAGGGGIDNDGDGLDDGMGI